MSSALEKARAASQVIREGGGKVERLNYNEKHKKNPKSFKWAVAAKCWDCTCEQRQEIKICPITTCPLWNFRPVK